jgi:hypothetical protein
MDGGFAEVEFLADFPPLSFRNDRKISMVQIVTTAGPIFVAGESIAQQDHLPQ